MRGLSKFLLSIALAATTLNTLAADSSEYSYEESIAFGDMNRWLTRIIEESFIIGSNTKTLYEIAPSQIIVGDKEYYNLGGSPWATSNVLAHVAGITKTNCSVFPDTIATGDIAAKLMTRIEKVKVLGLINISVIATGSVFLGNIIEPISGVSNPQSMLNSGIPFARRPQALRFDYKIKLSGEPNRVRMSGFGGKKTIQGLDMPMALLLLQKRWEDNEGNIHASRIGTMIVNYTANSDWKRDATYPIIYGDASKSPNFTPYMNVGYEQRYATNSRGENVPIIEESWGDANEMPTHIVLQFASSHGGAYIGSPGNEMWVDNVRLLY